MIIFYLIGGYAGNKKHLQIILCKDKQEVYKILERLINDKSFSYVNWNLLDYQTLCRTIKNKSFSLRNDFI